QREPSDEYEDYGEHYEDVYSSRSQILQEGQGEAPLEDELPDTTMLDSVILPAIASVNARVALSALQRAFTEAERIIPGMTMELVNEIVDSVEHVEDER
ncbi:hypothetical protein PILCRDRAFT_61744, partial [Piloderma croceum F 1598]